jgi:putative effector of murein hydrolase
MHLRYGPLQTGLGFLPYSGIIISGLAPALSSRFSPKPPMANGIAMGAASLVCVGDAKGLALLDLLGGSAGVQQAG